MPLSYDAKEGARRRDVRKQNNKEDVEGRTKNVAIWKLHAGKERTKATQHGRRCDDDVAMRSTSGRYIESRETWKAHKHRLTSSDRCIPGPALSPDNIETGQSANSVTNQRGQVQDKSPLEPGIFCLVMHFEEQYPNELWSGVNFISQMFHPSPVSSCILKNNTPTSPRRQVHLPDVPPQPPPPLPLNFSNDGSPSTQGKDEVAVKIDESQMGRLKRELDQNRVMSHTLEQAIDSCVDDAAPVPPTHHHPRTARTRPPLEATKDGVNLRVPMISVTARSSFGVLEGDVGQSQEDKDRLCRDPFGSDGSPSTRGKNGVVKTERSQISSSDTIINSANPLTSEVILEATPCSRDIGSGAAIRQSYTNNQDLHRRYEVVIRYALRLLGHWKAVQDEEGSMDGRLPQLELGRSQRLSHPVDWHNPKVLGRWKAVQDEEGSIEDPPPTTT
ncbi:MAG: hypothetical protein Q9168_004147 [Polycauliona sp. 1 TL-2023]